MKSSLSQPSHKSTPHPSGPYQVLPRLSWSEESLPKPKELYKARQEFISPPTIPVPVGLSSWDEPAPPSHLIQVVAL